MRCSDPEDKAIDLTNPSGGSQMKEEINFWEWRSPKSFVQRLWYDMLFEEEIGYIDVYGTTLVFDMRRPDVGLDEGSVEVKLFCRKRCVQ